MTHVTTNYHTHTPRCKHARGADREIVQAAIEAGIRVLGIADHTPYPGVSNMATGMRMSTEESADYFASFTALKEEFADQIELHIGVEAEYFPDLFDGLLDHLAQFPCEYMLLGQHFGSGDGTPYFGRPTDDPAVLEQYVSLVVSGIETGRFLYVAHPDLVPFTGDAALHDAQYRRICEAAKAHNMPLEVNILGFRQHRAYPRESFYRIAQEVGNTLILGADAHSPAEFTEPDVFDNCRVWAEQFGLPIVETLALKK